MSRTTLIWLTKLWLGALASGVIVWTASCGGDEGGGSSGGTFSCSQSCPDKLFCDANLGCADCLTNSDCGAGSPFCVDGKCKECAATADCGAGMSC